MLSPIFTCGIVVQTFGELFAMFGKILKLIYLGPFKMEKILEDTEWKWEVLNQLFPDDVRTKIAAIKPPSIEMQSDFPNWSASPDGKFSRNSAYSLLMDKKPIEKTDSHLFKLVWKWKGPNRIPSFLWKVAHCRLMTNEERRKINMTAHNSCLRCQQGPESIMHVLRDYAMDIWSPIIKPNNWAKFFSLGLTSWLKWNLDNEDIGNTPCRKEMVSQLVADCLETLRVVLYSGFLLDRNNSQGAEMWSLVHAMHIARHLHLDRVIF
ncbi:hypothetical protein TSUD_297100 [Trifolium subterraneum]|uniref:Reverse transcriptase zinc-binding domain-containing protein n=1 Tax=Trifolium subterraneum TaxID=3900 RepID=A0A2Z6NY78_TRISU|nr:hypothetical protein TSUD_297100 [Trifolium subterraneum]